MVKIIGLEKSILARITIGHECRAGLHATKSNLEMWRLRIKR